MNNVEIIKAKSQFINRKCSLEIGRKLRVAAYCRVSTDGEDQLNSYRSQVEHYTAYIKQKTEWEFAGIYADEAITGTQVAKREDFQRLINDCLNGDVDMILTKSISRFARNTLDTLKYVRMLKEKNVAVMFEEENINTSSMDGELLLTILSSVAQQEVQNISANVKKGLKMKMQRGEMVGYNGCLGYDYHPADKTLTINEKEAEIVRYIFKRYVEGAGSQVIARELREMGVPTKRGSYKWQESGVRGIIRNEKYIGDMLMGKTFTLDPISKRRLSNKGEEDKVYIRDHHEPIISKEVFYKAQEIMNARSGSRALSEAFHRKKYSRQFAFSCMLKCGYCGNSLSRRVWNSGSQYNKVIWHCVAHTQKGSKYCPHSKGIGEKIVEDAFIAAYNRLCKDHADVLDEFLSRVCEVLAENKGKYSVIDNLKEQIRAVKSRKSKLMDALLDGQIDQDMFDEKMAEINNDLKELEYMLEVNRSDINEVKDYEARITNFRKLLMQNEYMETFDRAIFESVMNYALIGGFDEAGNADPAIITFVFKAGVQHKNEGSLDSQLRQKIVVMQQYDDGDILCDTNGGHDRLSQLPAAAEIFHFDFPYKHVVFNKINDKIYKNVKEHCQVRVAITI